MIKMENEIKICINATLNPEDPVFREKMDILLGSVENVLTDTEEFYNATTALIKEMIVISARRKDIELNDFRPQHPGGKFKPNLTEEEILEYLRNALVYKGIVKHVTQNH